LSERLLWALAVVGTMHLAGGLVPVPASWPISGTAVLYNLWLIPSLLRYDHLVHAVGFGLAAVGWWQVLRHLAPRLRPTAGPMLLCWMAAQGCGALNEIAEYAAVLSLERTNVGGFDNAMLDLVANAVGAGVAVGILASRPLVQASSRKSSTWPWAASKV
jgi:putative membrane protein